MGHPLIDRLTDELGWPRLETMAEVRACVAEGTHCLFVPGDPRRNLESADVAVILPELRIAFQRAFDCAVVGDGAETELREAVRVLKTPSLIFFRDGAFLGGIPKVRDWSDYLARIPQILSAEPAPVA
ncbi:hydrogenase accessory protein [Psychromarinibacter sp. C21-152]|uniref:Hydrogenase expression/formation protein n=1 Tax=Psychromarinibacter sediminicola TaxID=3033385 RepID=A0AAE3NQL0_9RHOB|nr:hydrogenase accessory protein [Psychromarinibacter sediminicola]MDF0600226.1 hydrogenase accessory protein [Psychromarinibacter sediminicola]